jgi:hypothetical protein
MHAQCGRDLSESASGPDGAIPGFVDGLSIWATFIARWHSPLACTVKAKKHFNRMFHAGARLLTENMLT